MRLRATVAPSQIETAGRIPTYQVKRLLLFRVPWLVRFESAIVESIRDLFEAEGDKFRFHALEPLQADKLFTISPEHSKS